MSAITSDRPFFPPSTGQGATASVNATRVLREAQAAFFRPASIAPAPAPAPEAPVEPEPAPSVPRRPGSLLDIRV